ncbi:MAG: hypothetical protein ACKODH_02325 [Limisphaerales bacterium]
MPHGRQQPTAVKRRKLPMAAAEARRRAVRRVVRRTLTHLRVPDGKHADMSVYDLPRESVWVVFKQARGVPALRSAEVIVVCQRTGRILYDGPANDEG